MRVTALWITAILCGVGALVCKDEHLTYMMFALGAWAYLEEITVLLKNLLKQAGKEE
jgi:hypothetical protein